MILLFPAGSEALLSEIYAIPAVAFRAGGAVPAVKLGIPSLAKDGRIAYSHPKLHRAQADWLTAYAPVVQLLAGLPRNFAPIDETDPPPAPLDLELTTRPAAREPLPEPEDTSEWQRPADEPTRTALRDERKQQWQATLPEREFQGR